MKCELQQLNSYAAEFTALLKVERNLSANTLKAYSSDINCFFAWIHLRNIQVLDDKAIFAYFNYLQDELELHPRSIRRKYVTLKQFFSFLADNYGIHEKFFRFGSRKFQIPKNLPKTLSNEEISRLISSASKELKECHTEYHKALVIRNICIIECLYCLGLRIGEASGLNVADYNKDDNSVLIRGKGNKERILFISSPVVCQKLNEWLQINGIHQNLPCL